MESISALKSELAELKVCTSCRLSAIHHVHPTASRQPSCSPTLLACASSIVLALTLPGGCLRPCCCKKTQSQLSSLQDAHATQLSSQQEASARQLAQQLKTADAIIKELEGAAVSLQNQLAAEVERADGYSRELQR